MSAHIARSTAATPLRRARSRKGVVLHTKTELAGQKPVIAWRRADRDSAGGYSARMVVESLGRTRSSWLRELMPSFMKTLRRWYLTVRGLMNSRVPISGFERP